MRLGNVDILKRHLSGELHQIKAVFNERGCVFGTIERQHIEISGEGIQYRPDGKGNALPAMIYNGKLEIRSDLRFSEARVRTLASDLKQAALTAPVDELPADMATIFQNLIVLYAGKKLENQA